MPTPSKASNSIKRRRRTPSPRGAAALAVADVLGGRSLSVSLPKRSASLHGRDRGLAAELAYGVCRWYWRLSVIGRRLLDRPPRERDHDIWALLLCGLYQLQFTRVPAHAAVAETAGAARQLNKPWATAVLNGALRRFQRETAVLTAGLDGDPHTLYALPNWFVDALREAWPSDWARAAAALNEHPPMTLRVNLSRITLQEYAARLISAGSTARPVEGIPSALALDHPVDVRQLPGFDAGLVSVQDANAQSAAGLLDLGAGLSVLDACAAPGGKTGHLMEFEPNLSVTAIDIDAKRLQRVRENTDRLGQVVQIYAGDAAQPTGAWADVRYDRILLDVPCSATGVMRRHPDIRLLRRGADIAALAKRQAKILNAVWPLLKPGGKLLYVTCSVIPAENEGLIESFMQSRKDAMTIPIAADWGHACGHGRQLLPGDLGGDGFYYALLTQKDAVR